MLDRLFISLLLLALAPLASARISPLAKELINHNFSVIEGLLAVDLAQLDVSSVKASKGWGVAYNFTYDDNRLEGSSSSNLQQTTTNSHTLALTQSNFWGGSLSLSNTLSMVDQGRISSSLLGGAGTKLNQYNQGITYQQLLGRNRLGREDRAGLQLAHQGVELRRVMARLNEQQVLLQFSNFYLAAKLHNSLRGLQQRAYKRAVKRRALIIRRVKDGVALNVDLVQSKIAVLGKKEAINNAHNALNSSLEKIGLLLHRKVDSSDVGVFDMAKFNLSQVPNANWNQSLDKQLLEQQVLLSNQRLKKIDYSFAPSMDITFGLKGNEYDSSIGQSLSNGTILDQDREITVAFNLSLDLGSNNSKAERAKERIELGKLILGQQIKQKNFVQSFEQIVTQIKRMDQNLKSIKGRRQFARQVVMEYGKLYQLGKATLDQVIGAEERLIETEISLVRSLVEREGLVVSLAVLDGELKEYLDKASF